MTKSDIQVVKEIQAGKRKYRYFSLPELEKLGFRVSRMPRAIRIIAESMIRNIDGKSITEENVRRLLSGKAEKGEEISFKVSRVLMQDFTGVPAIVDLASMREKVAEMGMDPAKINPVVPVDLVIDHSVQVDYFGSESAYSQNLKMEFSRNMERYRFLKWASRSFRNLRVIPPSVGIVHQVNLEYLSDVVSVRKLEGEDFAVFDTLVGTDSHTTMVNGIGVLGWGVGGIEAEAAMLGEPIIIALPEIVGVNLHGKLRPGITATDLVLTLTGILRKANVVGKILEFYGDGLSELSAADRATVSNMCPEYGATSALFPVDDRTVEYLRVTGKSDEQIELVVAYMKAQGLYGSISGIEYDSIIDIDLSAVEASVSGPKLPQQQMPISKIGDSFMKFMEDQESSGNGKTVTVSLRSVPVTVEGKEDHLTEGDVVIAAITSCTNTSNPKVMMAAGLLAKKAYELGLRRNPKVKASLAPGSRVVTDYLNRSGLMKYLEDLGFYLVGYGCTTCIGNSGPLPEPIQKAVQDNDLNVAAVLSGNRNFEARIHRDVHANYLMSPPLVVAFAIAGRVTIDMTREPIGKGNGGKEIYLKDIWPSNEEIEKVMVAASSKEDYLKRYSSIDNSSEEWSSIDISPSVTYPWEENSTYIRNPPYFEQFDPDGGRKFSSIKGALPLVILGDSVTTDHISPAGSISQKSPAGKYLISKGVKPSEFNSLGSRRGNHEVMIRATFGNSRIRNAISTKEGPYTEFIPDGIETDIYDAATRYKEKGIPLIVMAGKEYGTGSSRDWAAKGPYLLGVRAVIAKSYERIHRSNLAGMGIIPLQFPDGKGVEELSIDPRKPIDLEMDGEHPVMVNMVYTDRSGVKKSANLKVRLDVPIEYEYFQYGGILQYVLGQIIKEIRG